MSTEVQHPTPTVGPRAMLAYLRDHPEGRFQGPGELCKRFCVSEDFVVKVLDRAEPQVKPRTDEAQRFFSHIDQAKKRVRELRDNAAKHPTTFVVVTTLIAEIVLVLVSIVEGHPAINLNVHGNTANVFGAGAVVPFAAVCLHMSLFFRRGMVRFALYGALAYWIVGGVPLAILEWSQTRHLGLPTSERVNLSLLILILHFVVSAIYAVVGVICSFLGEYRSVLRENRRVERMSRQELLERLFQLEARMESARNDPARVVRFSKVTTFLKSRLLFSAIACGFCFRMIVNLAIGAQIFHMLTLNPRLLPSFAPFVLSASLSLLNAAAIVLLAYIAPNLLTALFVGLLYAVGEVLAQLFNIPAQRDTNSLMFMAFVLGTALIPIRSLVLAAFAGIGAAIQTKTLEELNLQKNDEASLIAEQLKIQWRLAENTCSTTVMVVDVVRSTQMKEGADPLQVEYCFRKFQQWIEDISVSHGGSVSSTAGDGAVISFPACHNAFIAATEIQRRMPAFNQSWNRLTTRFRVRIGLHVGEVQGDLGKVQFAQVIDIAAHLQKVAPAGGVAVTAEIVASLGASSFVPLAVKSDGLDVFLALNPSGL